VTRMVEKRGIHWVSVENTEEGRRRKLECNIKLYR
jgi:hypothetical protein